MSVKKEMEKRKLERMAEFGVRLMNVAFKVVDFLFAYIDKRVTGLVYK